MNAWAKVGSAPLTCQCLSGPKVSKSLGDGDDDFDEYLCLIHLAHDLATHALMEGGYNGDLLKAMIIEQEAIKHMEPHLKERIKN